MKKIFLILIPIILIIIGYFLYKELYLKYFIVFEGSTIEKDLNREESKVLISEGSKFVGNINLKSGEIILKDNSSFSGNIILESGSINIGKNVIINGNIDFNGKIYIGENSVINGNISLNSDLNKHSKSKITGTKPSLFKTTNYPSFLEYFGSMPNSHKKEFGYIFITSHNMDIRGVDLKPENYFKNIYYYENNQLKSFDFNNKEKLKLLYDNARHYINLLPERKVGRFGVGFVTKNYAFDKKKPDMYLSSDYTNSILFAHEYGHIMDYAYGFIDIHNPKYPYFKKENSITDYGKFHVGEDFAEAYRYYLLHNSSFISKALDNSELKKKYNYMNKYVFKGKKY